MLVYTSVLNVTVKRQTLTGQLGIVNLIGFVTDFMSSLNKMTFSF